VRMREPRHVCSHFLPTLRLPLISLTETATDFESSSLSVRRLCRWVSLLRVVSPCPSRYQSVVREWEAKWLTGIDWIRKHCFSDMASDRAETCWRAAGECGGCDCSRSRSRGERPTHLGWMSWGRRCRGRSVGDGVGTEGIGKSFQQAVVLSDRRTAARALFGLRLTSSACPPSSVTFTVLVASGKHDSSASFVKNMRSFPHQQLT
jgi:hypothetical protein